MPCTGLSVWLTGPRAMLTSMSSFYPWRNHLDCGAWMPVWVCSTMELFPNPQACVSTASTLIWCTQALRPPSAPPHLLSGTYAPHMSMCTHVYTCKHTHTPACTYSSLSHAEIHTHLRPVTHPRASTTHLCSAHSPTPWRLSLASSDECPLPRNDSSKTASEVRSTCPTRHEVPLSSWIWVFPV